MKHYVCRTCGNIAAMVNDTGRRIGCCSKNMDELVPEYKEELAAGHKPHIKENENRVTVTVGNEDKRHPMLPEHAVAWVCLVTTEGSHRKLLRPDGAAEASFLLSPGERVIKAFAYCNVHGLWVAEVV